MKIIRTSAHNKKMETQKYARYCRGTCNYPNALFRTVQYEFVFPSSFVLDHALAQDIANNIRSQYPDLVLQKFAICEFRGQRFFEVIMVQKSYY